MQLCQGVENQPVSQDSVSLALKKLELLTLEMRREKKPTTEAHSGVATEVEGKMQDVKTEGVIAKPKRTRRKSRKRKTVKANDEVRCGSVPLQEHSQAMVQNVAEQQTLNFA